MGAMSKRKPPFSTGRMVGWTLAAGLAVGIIPAVLLWATRGNLPQEVAVHWGSDGTADGWMSVGGALFTGAIFITLLAGFMAGVGAITKSLRFMAPFTVGMSVAMAWLIYGTILAQAGGGTPRAGPYIFSSLLVGVAVGVVAYYWLRPRLPVHTPDETGTFVPSLPGHPEIRRWQGRTRVSTGLWVVSGIILLPGLVLVAVSAARDVWLAASILLATVAVVALMLVSVQRITIDGRGVTSTWLGLRATHIPLAEVRSAGHVEVEALGEFGGVGFRTAVDGRREGLVTSSGEALIVEREGHKDYVITVDDARSAARVLAMLLHEGRG